MTEGPEAQQGLPEGEPAADQPELSEAGLGGLEAAEAQDMASEVRAEPEGAVPAESRLGRFFRRALRWLTGFVVVFGLGFGATWFARVQPLTQELEELGTEADNAGEARDRLQREVEVLEGVREENQTLETALRETQGRLDLLNVLVDVTRAQLAIAEDDPTAAKAELIDTDARLAELGMKVGDDQVAALRERLELVREEVDADVFAAQRDLEVLANLLVSLERELFGDN
jgi:DnaJ-domain-containing protein 1